MTGQPSHDLPDRITLLPRDISRLRKNSVNFIAFTPGTSLNMRSSGGKAEERALLFWLLPDDWIANEKGALSLLTGGMGRDRFKGRVDELEALRDRREAARRRFARSSVEEPIDPAEPGASLRERFLALADQLGGRAAPDGRREPRARRRSSARCGASWQASASSRSSRTS